MWGSGCPTCTTAPCTPEEPLEGPLLALSRDETRGAAGGARGWKATAWKETPIRLWQRLQSRSAERPTCTALNAETPSRGDDMHLHSSCQHASC